MRKKKASAMAASTSPVAHAPVEAATITPWPLIDKYPTILGSNASLQTISSIFRSAQVGYRQQYVDLLDELLERELHGFAVLSQRILNVAGGRLEIVAAKTNSEVDAAAAEDVADFVGEVLALTSDTTQSLCALLWSLYYGVCAAEVGWANDGGVWSPKKLHFVHSRRLSYPDPGSWQLHVWDQGLVHSWTDGWMSAPTERLFGVCIDDYPGKFIVHSPQLRADYPTREGLGRQLAYWFAIKGMAARGASQYVERFGKPWVVGYHSTLSGKDGKPRAANQDDIAAGDAAVKALGVGSLAGASLPDTIKLELFGPGVGGVQSSLTHEKLIDLCNAEISKCVLGQTFTTDTSKFGSRSTAEVGQSGAMRIAQYDATCLAQTIQRDLIYWIVKLNRPNDLRLLPRVMIHVEDEPDPKELIARAVAAAGANMPIDADAIGDLLGLPMLPNKDGKPRRLIPLAPMKPDDVESLNDPAAAMKARQEAAAQAITPPLSVVRTSPQLPRDEAAE